MLTFTVQLNITSDVEEHVMWNEDLWEQNTKPSLVWWNSKKIMNVQVSIWMNDKGVNLSCERNSNARKREDLPGMSALNPSEYLFVPRRSATICEQGANLQMQKKQRFERRTTSDTTLGGTDLIASISLHRGFYNGNYNSSTTGAAWTNVHHKLRLTTILCHGSCCTKH